MSETIVWVLATSYQMSETATFVFMASSVWKRTVSDGYTKVAERTLKT